MWKHKNKDEEIEQNKTKYKSSLITSIQFTKSCKSNYNSYYEWCSECESSFKCIKDSSIESIPKLFKIAN